MNKRLLWKTKQQYRRSQDLPSALVLMKKVFSECIQRRSFKLPCYLPISGNSYKISITWITFRGCQDSSANFLFFTSLDVYFHGNQEKAVLTVAERISRFISKLNRIRFMPFWMNIIKKKLYEHGMVKMEYIPMFL